MSGTLMWDIQVEVKDEAALQELSSNLRRAIMQVKGVTDCDEVDSELDEADETPEDE